MSVFINQVVPNVEFQVFVDDGIKTTSLAEHLGKWLVLMFYPADFTFVCPTELKEAALRYEEIVQMGGEIISISTDSVWVHKAWHDTSPMIAKIKYPMAADPAAKLSREFGVYLEDEGVAQRSTFIIDPSGILKAYEMHDNAIGRSISEIIRKLKALQYVAKNNGEVCPASWEVGQVTLKESVDLVGKL